MPKQSLAMQLVVYEASGPRRGVLPYPLAASVTDVMNDIGAGTIDYLAGVQHSPLLEGLCEVAVEVAGGAGGWIEPGARLMRLKRSASEIEETQTRRYTLHSYGLQLGKMRMLREETLNENGERVLAGLSPGALIKTLFDESKGRGNVPAFTYSFTAEQDSAGVPWGGHMQPETLRFGDDLLSLLRRLADNGVVDWRVIGRVLHVYKADGLGVNRAASVRLRNGVDLIEAPDDEDATEMAGRIGVQGDDGRTYEAISPSSGPWGLWEEMVNASGVKDIGGLQFIGEVEQRRRSAPRVQMTRRVLVQEAEHLPLISYGVGDTITAPNDRSELAPLRVREAQITLGGDGLGANLTLNDRLLERDLRDRRTVSGLLGGASSSSGGSGVPSAGADKRKPKPPIGLVAGSAHLLTPAGDPFAVLDAQWVPVTEGTDGALVGVAKHELYARRSVVGEPWRSLATVAGSVGRAVYSPLPAGETWEFKVRAVSRDGVAGDFCDAITLELARDTTPPPIPSKPFLSSRLSVVTVGWDGRDLNGAPMPPDFARVDVWRQHGASWVLVGSSMQGARSSSVQVADLPYNETVTFRLTAVDTSGNASEKSVEASIVVRPLVNTDLIGQVITGANLVNGSINAADKIIGNTITGALIQALAINAGHIQANAITADKIMAGSITGVKIAANSISTNNLIVGDFENLASPPDSADWDKGAWPGWVDTTAGPSGRGLWAFGASTGKYAQGPRFNAAPGEKFFVSAVVQRAGTSVDLGTSVIFIQWFDKMNVPIAASAPINVGTNGTLTYSGVTEAPANTVYGVFRSDLRIPTGTPNPSCFAIHSEHLARRMTSGALIVDGSITASSLAADAITGKTITGGVINGAVIAGGEINGGTITGGTINGAVINGGLISASNGLRVTANAGIAFGPSGLAGIGYSDGSLQVTGISTRFGSSVTVAGGLSSYGFSTSTMATTVSGSFKASGSATLSLGYTSLSANVYSGGDSSAMARASSLRVLKLDRERIPAHYGLLDAPTMTWRDRAQVEQDPETMSRVAGLVAEDLAVVSGFHGDAFRPLLAVDEEGELQGINYDRIIAYLLPIVRDIHDRLLAVEGLPPLDSWPE